LERLGSKRERGNTTKAAFESRPRQRTLRGEGITTIKPQKIWKKKKD